MVGRGVEGGAAENGRLQQRRGLIGTPAARSWRVATAEFSSLD
jgi:hypothetical protein